MKDTYLVHVLLWIQQIQQIQTHNLVFTYSKSSSVKHSIGSEISAPFTEMWFLFRKAFTWIKRQGKTKRSI